MIDIHSHILNNVDDGSTSLENTLEILKKAENAGFTDVILTPHYIEGYYENKRSDMHCRIRNLKKVLYRENIIVNLHQGNEIFLTENSPELIKRGDIATLGNTRYVLFEVPFSGKMMNLEEIIYKIKDLGLIPVLAHPERFSFIQENPDNLIKMLKMGVLAQSNYGSFMGFYGKEVQQTAEVLLQNKLIQFLGSDTHKHGQIYENIDKILRKIKSISGDDKYINEITTTNARDMLNDLDIYAEYPETIKSKKKVFFFF